MLRFAVVGTGIMGANHARIGSQIRDIELTHVVDPTFERAEALASEYGGTPHRSVSEIASQIDLAVVATPTSTHFEVASELIAAGVHVLVEKPIASTVEEGRALADAAAAAGTALMVGHVERFNPAVLELDNLIDQPLHVAATRVSAYSPRVEVGVILDLMIHDIDIVLNILGHEIEDIHCVTSSARSDTEDLASVLLRFRSGATAALTASRLGQQKIRELSVTQESNHITVDLLRQDVTINRVAHAEYLSSQGARYRQTGVVEIPFLEHRGEPLALELSEFVSAVSEGRPPRVDGEQGLRALQVAHDILAAAGA